MNVCFTLCELHILNMRSCTLYSIHLRSIYLNVCWCGICNMKDSKLPWSVHELLLYLIWVFAVIVPSSVTRAPSHSWQPHRYDGGRGLRTSTTYGGVQERGWSFGAANQWEGAVEDELCWAQARRRRERGRGRDLGGGGGGWGGRSVLLRLALIGLWEDLHEETWDKVMAQSDPILLPIHCCVEQVTHTCIPSQTDPPPHKISRLSHVQFGERWVWPHVKTVYIVL